MPPSPLTGPFSVTGPPERSQRKPVQIDRPTHGERESGDFGLERLCARQRDAEIDCRDCRSGGRVGRAGKPVGQRNGVAPDRVAGPDDDIVECRPRRNVVVVGRPGGAGREEERGTGRRRDVPSPVGRGGPVGVRPAAVPGEQPRAGRGHQLDVVAVAADISDPKDYPIERGDNRPFREKGKRAGNRAGPGVVDDAQAVAGGNGRPAKVNGQSAVADLHLVGDDHLIVRPGRGPGDVHGVRAEHLQ